MFENTKAFSGFAVDDIEAAKRFYGETLGLKVSEAHGLLTLHIAGDRPTSSTRGPATSRRTTRSSTSRSTTSTPPSTRWPSAASQFERYDGMEQDEKGIMRAGGPYIAWFTDPAGNVLSVLQER